eukprot:508663_1
MPLSHSQIVKQTQTTVLLITIIVLCRMIIAIYLATNQSRLKKSIFSHYCTSTYQVFPTLDVFELIRDPNDFYDEVKMPPHIWLDYVLNPLHEYLKWPRKWITKVSVDCKYYPYKTKACQISIPNRLLRFAMWMAGQPMRTLKRYFKQSKTTVRRDIIFIAHMMNWVLSPVHLYVPKVGSEEYKFLLGNGVFKGLFKDGIYMMDVVKCFIKKPVKFQSNCYDKYKAGHTLGCLTMCDGFGVVRYVHGPGFGRKHDLKLYATSDLFLNQQNYVKPTHYIFADGAWRFYPLPILTRYHGRNNYTTYMHAFNYKFSQCRSLKENTYGRAKKKYPVIRWNFPLSTKQFFVIFRCAMIKANILTKTTSPYRKKLQMKY